MSFREEFRLKNVGFSGVSADRFHHSQWRVPGIVVVVYRIVLAIYSLVNFSMSAEHQNGHNEDLQQWGAYLTIWTYTMLTIYFVVHAIVTIAEHIMMIYRNNDSQLCHQMDTEDHIGLFHELQNRWETSSDLEVQPLLSEMVLLHGRSCSWYHILVWILFNIASTASLMVTLVFWAVLLPMMSNASAIAGSNENLQLHLINSVLVLIEHAMTAVPVRVLHLIYPLLYGIIYMLFSLFYWVDDHHHVMYPILDWSKPGATVGYVLLVGFIVIPLFQLFIYLLYRLKLQLFSNIFNRM